MSRRIKARNNARSKLRIWPMLSNRPNTRTFDTKLAYEKGTDAFLTAWGTFCAIRGNLATVYSDPGSNLARAVTNIGKDYP
jgi:hypothetical protein